MCRFVKMLTVGNVRHFIITLQLVLYKHFLLYTWSVQKISSILNFRGLRIFNFRYFCGVMLVLVSLTYADEFGHFECSVNF